MQTGCGGNLAWFGWGGATAFLKWTAIRLSRMVSRVYTLGVCVGVSSKIGSREISYHTLA